VITYVLPGAAFDSATTW